SCSSACACTIVSTFVPRDGQCALLEGGLRYPRASSMRRATFCESTLNFPSAMRFLSASTLSASKRPLAAMSRACDEMLTSAAGVLALDAPPPDSTVSAGRAAPTGVTAILPYASRTGLPVIPFIHASSCAWGPRIGRHPSERLGGEGL